MLRVRDVRLYKCTEWFYILHDFQCPVARRPLSRSLPLSRWLALREIADRRIDQAMIDQIDVAERERAEREALEWAAAEVDDDLSKAGED
jgi:hypothetical protein